MDVLKVKTSLVHVRLKLFKVGILKKNHEKCSVCLRDYKGFFDVQKDIQMLISNGVLQAFEIVCPPRESTPPANSTKHLDIKFTSPFPYKYDKAAPWRYEPTITVNGVEKPLVNNKVVTNIVDASGIMRSGRLLTPVNLRGGKHVVTPKSRPI
ncbi:hypothetical protein KIW84_022579 [Lathyrus oleraceus]|uniref:Uncharacterized protein n=1 Tax=Pisum sativum TaxID=3888 RepID=A0A9D4YAU9_PEA|nr:hypothetical protein KIW84_022579 [Pisum sativum]